LENLQSGNISPRLSGLKTNILGNLYALQGAYLQQLRVTRRSASYLNFFIGGVASVAVLAWIAARSQNPLALAYISIGACLMVMWNTAVFRIGWLLDSELWDGVFHINLVSRAPVTIVMLGKSAAFLSFTVVLGAGAFMVILAISQRIPDVANLPALLVSLVFVMISMIAAGFIFSPVAVLMGGRAGFFNAIMPFGVVFSGFLYPISILPMAFKIIARLLPTSWAMDGVIHSIGGQVSMWRIAGDWGIALAISLVYVFLTHALLKVVERKVRRTGVLSIY
jgi:ABC-type multidrug transport system permease subunit